MGHVSISPTGSISWTDITPPTTPPYTGDWTVAVNNDALLIAASNGSTFYTSAFQGAGWAGPSGPGASAIAISDTAAIGPGPGVYPAGIPPSWVPSDGNNYQTITAAGAHYQTLTVGHTTYSATPTVPSPPLTTLITKWASTYQIDADAMARQLLRESNWCPNAVGGTRPPGYGIAQWTLIGGQYGYNYPVAVYNPDNAIMYAAIYLSTLRSQFHGNLGLAFAAYNGGPGAVQHWLDTGQPNTGVWAPTALTPQYVLNFTGHTMWEWAAQGYKLFAANAGTSNVAVSNNSAGAWVDQLPHPGALPNASVAIAGSVPADAVAASGSALWITRSL